jgi:hypothetical protein
MERVLKRVKTIPFPLLRNSQNKKVKVFIACVHDIKVAKFR